MIPEILMTLTITSYNPVARQTDSSPCIGASLIDLCEYKRRTGNRPLALSQELVGRAKHKLFRYGDRVMLYSENPACRGEFVVLDTMNERYRKRGDILFLDPKNNTSCIAGIAKLPRTAIPQR